MINLPLASHRFSFAALVLALIGACAAACSDPPPAAAAAPATVPSSEPALATLTITVKDLRNRKGDLIFGVFTQADGFPNVQSKSVYWEVKPADPNGAPGVTFTTRLPPGRYAAGVLHDENRNGDLDKGVGGIPKEGYGVTNNPKPRFRKARFDEATFNLPPGKAELTISLQYF
jgi:uncharacterized protein (DUF2141 family)